MNKQLSILAAAVAMSVSASAHALYAGDIAVIAYNTDGEDDFAWVTLVDIAAGTTINFTDSSWQGVDATAAFRGTEHLNVSGAPLTWTSASTLAAGSVVSYSGKTGKSWSTGSGNTTAALDMSTSGDQIFVFEGSTSSPSFVYGLQFAHASGIIAAPTVSSSTNTTNVPGALTLGSTMTDVGNYDDGYYSGITSGTKAALLAAIADTNNWTKSNDALASSNWASSFTVTTAAPVPEADTYAFIALGMGLVGLLARRRKV